MNDPVIARPSPYVMEVDPGTYLGAGVAGPTINRFVMVHMKGPDSPRSK